MNGIVTHGQYIIASGNGITASGNGITIPDNVITASDNVITASGNGITIPDNVITASGNVTTASDNVVTASDNGITASDNVVTASDNGITIPDNVITASDNVVTASDNGITASGNVITASGNVVTASGNVVTASDNVVTASGNVTTASGNVVTASGNVVTASGNVVTASGNVVTASDNGITASGNGITIPGNGITIPGNGITTSGIESEAVKTIAIMKIIAAIPILLMVTTGLLLIIVFIFILFTDEFSTKEHQYYQTVIGELFEEEMGFEHDSPYIEVNGKTREVMAIRPIDPNGTMAKAGLTDYMIVVEIEGLDRLSFTGFCKTLYESQGKVIKLQLVKYENGPPIKNRPKTMIEVRVPDISSRYELTDFSTEDHEYYQRIGRGLSAQMPLYLGTAYILENERTRHVVVMDRFLSKKMLVDSGVTKDKRHLIIAGIEGLNHICLTGFYKTLWENQGKKIKIFLVEFGDGPSLEDRPKTVLEVSVPN